MSDEEKRGPGRPPKPRLDVVEAGPGTVPMFTMLRRPTGWCLVRVDVPREQVERFATIGAPDLRTGPMGEVMRELRRLT
jgi:hypothetical protein